MAAKKGNIMNLLYNISIASFIALFLFLFIAFLRMSTLTSTGLKSYIDAQFSTLKLSIFILGVFFLVLLVLYRKNEIQENLTIISEIFGKIYSEKIPFIIMGIGYSLGLVVFLVILNFPPQPPPASTLYGLILMVILGFGLFIFVPIGVILLILGFCAKKYLERRDFNGRTWIVRNKDTIFDVITMITAIITVILTYLQYILTLKQ